MKIAVFVLSMFLSASAFASNCAHLYPNGIPIKVLGAIELCNTQFVTVYDARKHAAIFSSERFNPSRTRVERTNAFHLDSRVPYVKASDYRGSGYDRGHLAPAGNMGSDKEMFESFAMTNMTPQSPTLNQGNWATLEDSVRRDNTKPVWVITGTFYGVSPTMIGPRKDIPVPQSYYKCVYSSVTTCYKAKNIPNGTVTLTTVGVINIWNMGYNLPR